jgi:hypothetical protein
MIVAEPLSPADPVCRSAAMQWNAVWIGEKLNRYFTVTAAEMDTTRHAEIWDTWVDFKVVHRSTFEEGWR